MLDGQVAEAVGAQGEVGALADPLVDPLDDPSLPPRGGRDRGQSEQPLLVQGP